MPTIMGPPSRMASENAAKYKTIYDVISKESGNFYEGTQMDENNDDYKKKEKLYAHIAKLLGVFALCDLRHDFQQGANIFLKVDGGDSGTVGQLFCKPVAGAFYAPKSKRFNELHTYLKSIYKEKITSNHAAITFFKSQMDNFFLNIFLTYRDLFEATAYPRYYDMCAEISKDYINDLDFTDIRNKIAPEGERSKQVFYIDAQTGNPFDKIFNHAPGGRAKYFYNFASAMDPGPKSAGDVHKYMDTYVQVNPGSKEPLISEISKAFTSYNASTSIIKFEFDNNVWATTINVKYENANNNMKFSLLNQPSVNNMGLAIIRGRERSISDIPKSIPTKLSVKDTNEILVNHLFKSLGDRLQDYTMSHKGISYIYKHVSEIKNPPSSASLPVETTENKNIVVFTNDELNNYQLYMMGINTVMTGFNVVTAYINKATEPLTYVDVRNFFIDRVAIWHNELASAEKPIIVINNLETIRKTIYEAFLRKATNDYIEKVPILNDIKNMVDNITSEQSKDYFEQNITKDNYQQYLHLMTDTLLQYLRTYSQSKNISNTFIRSEFRRVDSEALQLNRELANATLTGDTFRNKFERLQLLVSAISSILVQLQLGAASSTVIAHAIMRYMYRNIQDKIYQSKILITELTDRNARSSIYKNKLETIKQNTGIDCGEKSDEIIKTLLAEATEIDDPVNFINTQIKRYENDAVHPGLVLMGNFYLTIICILYATKYDYKNVMESLLGMYVNIAMPSDKKSIGEMVQKASPAQFANTNVLELEYKPEQSKITTKNLKTRKAPGASKAKTKTKVITQKNKQIKQKTATKQRKINQKRGQTKLQKSVAKELLKSAMKSQKDQKKSKLKGTKKTQYVAEILTETKASKKQSLKTKEKISAKTKGQTKGKTKEKTKTLIKGRATAGPLSTAFGAGIPPDYDVLAVASNIEEPDNFLTVNPMSVIINIGRAFIDFLNPFSGGGSKTRGRELKLIDLCIKKLEFMAAALITQPEYAAVLVSADRVLSLIIEDFDRMENSKIRPFVLRSSLSVIREDDRGQSGGGTMTITETKVAPTMHIVGPYSRIENAPKQKVATITKAAAKSLLEQRLAAFLWFGFSRGPEARRLETEIFKPLLPDIIDDIAGDAHNVLFWQVLFSLGLRPYDFFASEYDEGLNEHFEHGSRSPFKKARARRAAKKAANATTRRLLPK